MFLGTGMLFRGLKGRGLNSGGGPSTIYLQGQADSGGADSRPADRSSSVWLTWPKFEESAG